MYDDQVRCPVVIRTPMGGRRGYGPTHSQSLEKLVFGVPDLKIVAVSPVHDVESLFLTAVSHDDAPVLFLENKLLYTRPLQLPDEEGWIGSFATVADPAPYPTRVLSPTEFRKADAVIATYGGMTEICLEAAERLLLEHELAVEVVVFSQIQPHPVEALEPSLRRAPVLVTVEEGVGESGWGAEVVAACAERGWIRKAARVGAQNTPIPAARTLEEVVLPQTDHVVAAVLKTL
jgi:pyruvate/2-oxoglutarate/acetoin dehydrogenase E1 component